MRRTRHIIHKVATNFSDHARIVHYITVRPQELVPPDLFVSCMDNLNISLRITCRLVGMSEKLEITFAGVVFTRRSQYFNTTDAKQNALLQSVIQCILQENTVS
jgi:hypothetical protein